MSSGESLMGRILRLGGASALEHLSGAQCALLPSLWPAWARPEQLPPEGKRRTWYVRGGRGSGKSRTGAETLTEWIEQYPRCEWGIIAPTAGDVHKKCVEGRSGIRKCLVAHGLLATGNWERDYKSSKGEIHLKRGGVIALDGADDSALRVQGYNLSGAWCDEIGLWKVLQGRPPEQQPWWRAWFESIKFAIRFAPGLIVATGTPKRGHPLVRMLLKDERVAKTHMTIRDNIANLDEETVEEHYETFAGTALEAQELEGEYLDEIKGALWVQQQIEEQRVSRRGSLPTKLVRIVVAIDPAVSYEETSDLTGIVAAGLGEDGHVYILGDLSVKCRPRDWLQRALDAYNVHRADVIVGEKNNGGKVIEDLLRSLPHGENAPYKEVWASQGKRTRAEPISMVYEQGKVHHVGNHPDLEAEMTTWVPGVTTVSPNRVDALVWAVTELLAGASMSGDFERVPKPWKPTRLDEVL